MRKKKTSEYPATIPMILKAQKEHREVEILKKVFWHHDFTKKDEPSEILWGNRVAETNARIYNSYIIARRVVFTTIKFVRATHHIQADTKRMIDNYLRDGYKIEGIVLNDVTKDPKKRLNDTFLHLVADQLWDQLVKNVKFLKTFAEYRDKRMAAV